jgi:hypothetical protein
LTRSLDRAGCSSRKVMLSRITDGDAFSIPSSKMDCTNCRCNSSVHDSSVGTGLLRVSLAALLWSSISVVGVCLRCLLGPASWSLFLLFLFMRILQKCGVVTRQRILCGAGSILEHVFWRIDGLAGIITDTCGRTSFFFSLLLSNVRGKVFVSTACQNSAFAYSIHVRCVGAPFPVPFCAYIILFH